jgi:hypothetical protein
LSELSDVSQITKKSLIVCINALIYPKNLI